MKKNYLKPEAEYICFEVEEKITDAGLPDTEQEIVSTPDGWE